MLTPGEKKVLKKIAECHVIKKDELARGLGESNHAVIEAVVKSLMQKDYVTAVSPVGSKCFIITRNGMQALNGDDA